ncbi:hypothetical protein M8818_007854 [Zalaria obscura]|uniref:Uncharacterized protein n=1 Tax=Zalaria obscura TaxID=2024903 RepID=A0ACC3S4D3_9PEZI
MPAGVAVRHVEDEQIGPTSTYIRYERRSLVPIAYVPDIDTAASPCLTQTRGRIWLRIPRLHIQHVRSPKERDATVIERRAKWMLDPCLPNPAQKPERHGSGDIDNDGYLTPTRISCLPFRSETYHLLRRAISLLVDMGYEPWIQRYRVASCRKQLSAAILKLTPLVRHNQ